MRRVNSNVVEEIQSKIYQLIIYIMRYLLIEAIPDTSPPIYSTCKVISGFPVIPYGQGENRSRYKIATNLLMDPHVVDLQSRKKIYDWTRATRALCPVLVPKDKNSLCHACSVTLFGILDYILVLKRCLNQTLGEHRDIQSPFAKRWKHQLGAADRNALSDGELLNKWLKVCDESSVNRHLSHNFTDFWQLHLFVLAHICRRPIITVGDHEKDNFKSSIYLPVILPSKDCSKSFLYLAYHEGYFTPLIFVNEPNSDSIRDLCVPIVTERFESFDVPFLLEGEDREMKLQEYLFITKIGFMKPNEFVEVAAARMLERQTSSQASGIDPKLMFRICFQVLSRGLEPGEVQKLWKHCLSLKNEFEQYIPELLTDDNMEAADDNNRAEVENVQIPSIVLPTETPIQSRSEGTALITSTERNESSETPSRTSSNLEPVISNSRVQNLRRASDSKDSGVGTVSSGNWTSIQTSSENDFEQTGESADTDMRVSDSLMESARHSSEAAANLHSVSPLPDLPENYVSSVPQRYSDAGNGNTSVANSNTQATETSIASQCENDLSSSSDSENSERPSQSSPQLHSLTRYASGIIIEHISHSRVVVTRCLSAVFTLFHLVYSVVDSADHKVTAKLERTGLGDDNRVKLTIDAPPNTHIRYQRVREDKLEADLTRDHDVYQLHVKLPFGMLTETERNEPDFMPLPSDDETTYIDMGQHQDKCRTSGCMNRGESQYNNLCLSCHQAWEARRDRPT